MGHGHRFFFRRAQEEEIPGTIQADKNSAKFFYILLKVKYELV